MLSGGICWNHPQTTRLTFLLSSVLKTRQTHHHWPTKQIYFLSRVEKKIEVETVQGEEAFYIGVRHL